MILAIGLFLLTYGIACWASCFDDTYESDSAADLILHGWASLFVGFPMIFIGLALLEN